MRSSIAPRSPCGSKGLATCANLIQEGSSKTHHINHSPVTARKKLEDARGTGHTVRPYSDTLALSACDHLSLGEWPQNAATAGRGQGSTVADRQVFVPPYWAPQTTYSFRSESGRLPRLANHPTWHFEEHVGSTMLSREARGEREVARKVNVFGC